MPGFLFLGAIKIYFDLRRKQKRRELRSSLGFYAWIEPKIRKTRQRNPLILLSLIGEMKS